MQHVYPTHCAPLSLYLYCVYEAGFDPGSVMNVIMKDGHIQQVGTPDQVYHQPANTFVAQFIGAPSMNLLAGVATEGGVDLPGVASIPLPGKALHAGRPVRLGIRPEDLHLASDGAGLFAGEVSVAEPLGAETLLHVALADHDIIATGPGRNRPKAGDRISLTADPAQMHLFDADTGVAIT